MRSNLARIAVSVSLLLAAHPAVAATKLLRFPDIHGDRVVFCLRRRPVAGAGRRRHGDAADRPSRAGAVPQVLARRRVDRLHRPVRRRRAGLRRSPPTGGVPRQLTYYPAARAAAAALGLRQPGLRLDARRQGGAVPLAARRLRCSPRRGCSPSPWRAGCRCRCRCPVSGAGDFSPDGDAGRLLAAVPRLPHLEALRGRLGAGPVHLRSRQPRADAGHRPSRAPIAIRCGSATRSTSARTATAR